MITFFSSAKPFRGPAAIHQRNAIKSWTQVCPGVEVVLFGVEEGTDQIAAEFGVRHIPDVPTTDLGTPRLDAMFARAQAEARNNIVCYINADIVVCSDFAETARRIMDWWQDVLMIGHRWDVRCDELIDFHPGWKQGVRQKLLREGHRSTSDALDYFVFRKGAVIGMPAFAIGRPAWDNWLIMHARRTGQRIVDASACILVLHPTHDYSHVPRKTGRAWEGPEADRNRELARFDCPNFKAHLYTIRSADWVAEADAIRPARTLRHLSWRVYVWLEEIRILDMLRIPVRALRRLGRSIVGRSLVH